MSIREKTTLYVIMQQVRNLYNTSLKKMKIMRLSNLLLAGNYSSVILKPAKNLLLFLYFFKQH